MCLCAMENGPSANIQTTSRAKQEADYIDAFEPHTSTTKDQRELKKEGLSDKEYARTKDNTRRKIVWIREKLFHKNISI